MNHEQTPQVDTHELDQEHRISDEGTKAIASALIEMPDEIRQTINVSKADNANDGEVPVRFGEKVSYPPRTQGPGIPEDQATDEMKQNALGYRKSLTK